MSAADFLGEPFDLEGLLDLVETVDLALAADFLVDVDLLEVAAMMKKLDEFSLAHCFE